VLPEDMRSQTMGSVGDMRSQTMGSIEDMRSQGMGEVDAMKAQAQGMMDVDSMKARGMGNVEAMKSQGRGEFEAMKSQGMGEIEALKAQGRGEVEDLKAQGRGEFEAMKARSMSEVESLKERSLSEVDSLKERAQGMVPEGMLDIESGEELMEAFPNRHSTWLMKALAFAFPVFYLCYFLVALMLCFATDTDFQGDEPFDHVHFDPTLPEGTDDKRPQVTWLSMVLTFSLAGTALVYFGARDAERALDMATAMQSAHFFLVTFVTKEMPQNWIWWCTAMPLFFIQGRLPQAWLGHFGDFLSLRRRAKRTASTLPFG